MFKTTEDFCLVSLRYMESSLSSPVAASIPTTFSGGGGVFTATFLSKPPQNPHLKILPKLTIKTTSKNLIFPNSCFSSSITRTVRAQVTSTSTSSSPSFADTEIITGSNQRHWMVFMEAPPPDILADKPRVIDYYVNTLERVMGSQKDAQKCMYDASWDTHFGFCCDVEEEVAEILAGVPGVVSVKPDLDFNSVKKDYNYSKIEFKSQSSHFDESSLLFPSGTTKQWLVRMSRPSIGAIRKAQVVDYYVQVLMRILGNEKDAQMCMYHISWQSNYGFCCELDDECARELLDVPGVLSVQPDENFGSDDKDYGGENLKQSRDSEDSSTPSVTTDIKTKKLFITGLSFYTSEKTLSAAFEGFGELVEVKVIMDKISKRSKGYAFVEYTTEEAASAALREMNGKIINGWMITVDVAKKTPPKFITGRPRFTS